MGRKKEFEYSINVKLTKNQFEQVENMCSEKGGKNISDLVRYAIDHLVNTESELNFHTARYRIINTWNSWQSDLDFIYVEVKKLITTPEKITKDKVVKIMDGYLTNLRGFCLEIIWLPGYEEPKKIAETWDMYYQSITTDNSAAGEEDAKVFENLGGDVSQSEINALFAEIVEKQIERHQKYNDFATLNRMLEKVDEKIDSIYYLSQQIININPGK